MIEVHDLSIDFPTDGGTTRVVDGVSLSLARGRTLGLVGESGSGKSMTALALLGLVPPPGRITSGSIGFDGLDLSRADDAVLRKVRGRRIAMIFQDASSALNPVLTIGFQIAEAHRIHHGSTPTEARTRALAALREVGLPDAELRLDSYPHQLSGGMRQRAMIAMALAAEPEILIADEPTTALDVTVQAQILALLRAVQARRGLSMLFISHDLAVVAQMADHIAVMRAGRIVERNDTATLFTSPGHDYTRALIAATHLPDRLRRGPSGGEPILAAHGIEKRYAIRAPGLFGRLIGHTHALDNVSLTLARGETLGIVGESGSGKTTLAKTLLGLTHANSGSIRFSGIGIDATNVRRPDEMRRKIQMVFQDPYASLNPRLSIGDSIGEPLYVHKIGTPSDRREAIREALRAVGIDPDRQGHYPHQFSGGERQRIAIARAVVARPDAIVADEPLSSLDVSIRAQIIELMLALKESHGLAYILISHDLAVVAHMADRVAVMYAGRIVEAAPAESLFESPRHPYSRLLISAAPRLGRPISQETAPMGEPVSLVAPPVGCPFQTRCPKRQEICDTTPPRLLSDPDGDGSRIVACHFPNSV